MCITTFLHDSELNVPTSNKELNKLLITVREETKENWQITERTYTVSKAWGMRHEEVKVYDLYKWVGGCGPWQLINFYSSKSGTSINTSNSVEVIMAFLLGIRSGFYAEGAKNAS
jgi:hypothetical protein